MNASTPITAQRWRLRASDFELLFEAGALEDVGRTELIDGDIYAMSPQLMRHGWIKTELGFLIRDRLTAIGSDLRLVIEVSVVVADDSTVMPDIVLTRYAGPRFIPAETVALVVEVSDSTLSTDLGRKAELYAAAGIPEYWVVDVNGGRVLTHVGPGADGYAERGEVPFGAVLEAVTIKGLRLNGIGLG